MKYKSLIATAALLTVSAFASAQSTNALVALTSSNAGSHSAGISKTFNVAGIFEDTYTFDAVLGGAFVNGTLQTLGSAANDDIDLTSVTLNGKAFNLKTFAFEGNSDGREFASLGKAFFNDPIVLVVKGVVAPTLTAGSAVAATYSASFNVTTAVPEPETLALMLAGLGVVAYKSRRRSAR